MNRAWEYQWWDLHTLLVLKGPIVLNKLLTALLPKMLMP